MKTFPNTIDKNCNNPKQLWKSVNLIRDKGSKTANVTSLEIEDDNTTWGKNIAEAVRSFFVTVGPSLSEKLPERN